MESLPITKGSDALDSLLSTAKSSLTAEPFGMRLSVVYTGYLQASAGMQLLIGIRRN